MMKTTRHSLLAKGLLILLSLLVLVFAFTYTWFVSYDTPVSANNFSATASASGDFDFALGFYNSQTVDVYKHTTWYTGSSVELDLTNIRATDGEDYNLLADYAPIDLTGNGATLVRPAMRNSNREIDTTTTGYTRTVPNVQYIMFDMIFRSSTPGEKITLDSGSIALGACEIGGTQGTALISESAAGSNGYNVSTYGDFSRDAVVGALRVAFVGYDEDEITIGADPQVSLDEDDNNILLNTDAYLNDSPNLIWIPRPDIKLNPGVVNGEEQMTGWTLTTGITSSNTAAWSTTATHQYYIPAQQQTVTYNTAVTNPSGSAGDSIIELDQHSGNYYYGKVKVVIWLEGTDTEARRAISGGRFKINFDFHGS